VLHDSNFRNIPTFKRIISTDPLNENGNLERINENLMAILKEQTKDIINSNS